MGGGFKPYTGGGGQTKNSQHDTCTGNIIDTDITYKHYTVFEPIQMNIGVNDWFTGIVSWHRTSAYFRFPFQSIS